jgi:nucleoside-diphosphate kinase
MVTGISRYLWRCVMVESTLVLIKPDGVMMGSADAIVQRYQAAGLEIVRRKDLFLRHHQIKAFYAQHEGRFYFPGLVLAMISGPVLALVLKGENAIARVRELNGHTDPGQAAPGTIRRDFRSAGGPFNTVHGSDSVESAHREMEIIFER